MPIHVFSCLLLLSMPTTTLASPPNGNDWQTVYPDAKVVIPLFGEDGPRWQLDYEDTVIAQADEYSRKKTIPSNLTARVPGDVVSDLLLNGLIHDPYWDKSLWDEQEYWLGPQRQQEQEQQGVPQTKDPFAACQFEQTRIWTYATQVELLDNVNVQSLQLILVVESLQMGATIYWDGIFLQNITDQFLRYTLPIPHSGKNNNQKHNLTITFDPTIETDGRFMACSGGWDWAPYTRACDKKGRHFLSRGIVQPIYIVGVQNFAINHIVPKIYYQGRDMPRTPMGKHPNADFKVTLDLHLDWTTPREDAHSSSTNSYVLVVTSNFTNQTQTKAVERPKDGGTSSIISFAMMASKDQIELWWPNGMGAQILYDVQVGIRKQKDKRDHMSLASQRRRLSNTDNDWITKRIGFRTSAIVTINEAAEAIQDDNDGTGMHGMFFRVNGALVMARGANIIPADQLEGRHSYNSHTDDKTYQIIVQSAATAHMNIIRVWGGGKILPRAFYDACDESGILVYQDQMFDDGALHGPAQTATIQEEIRHTVRSLSPHASIVIWNGCNECHVVMGTKTEIYAKFVLQTVASEDDSRSIWPSSPSKYGWSSGVNRRDSTPNGQPLSTRNPKDHKNDPPLESHGPYQRGFSNTFPGVNGVDQHFPFPSKPSRFYQGNIGPVYPNVFASEFGCSVWSSFESMSGTVRPEHWSLHGGAPPDQCKNLKGLENVCAGSNVMSARNYPCEPLLQSYFGNATSLDKVGETAFQAQLYLCMVGQTLYMKGDIERRRSENSFGVLIWQLNENWPTGGWGLLEYSGQSALLPGQVLGGRWKPLMHLLKDVLFSDVIAACGYHNQCFVRNDGMDDVDVTVFLEAWNIQGSRNRCSVANYTFEATLPGGVSSTARFQAPTRWTANQYDTILVRVFDKSGTTLMADSPFLWGFPKEIPNLISTKVTVTVHSIEPAGVDKSAAVVSLSSDALALYVVLTTQASGRFEENAFVLRANEAKVVFFVPLMRGEEVDIDLLRKTTRVEHLGYYF